MIGPRPNLYGRQAGTHKRLEVSQPVLTNADLEKVRSVETLAGWRLPHHDDRHDLGRQPKKAPPVWKKRRRTHLQ